MPIWTWGANSHGQLGLHHVSEQVAKPSKITNDGWSKIKQISCGGGHSMLLDEDGKLYATGWNEKLQLSTDKELNKFERIWPLSGVVFTQIVCGWDFSCGVTDENFLFVWGSNSNGQLGLPRDNFSDKVKLIRLQVNAIIVSMGLRHTAIVNPTSNVWVTGHGKHGQLGLGDSVKELDRFTHIPSISNITHLACGQNHTVAWCSQENALYVWGDNRHGQLLLDIEKYKKIFTPQKIDIGVKHKVKKLLSGWTHVLLWLETGTLMTWGRNTYGQLGIKDTTGKIVKISLPGERQVKDVVLGSEHTVCLAHDNTLWAWGWNEHANTGIKIEQNIFEPTLVPIELSNTERMTKLFAGSAHNFVITEDEINDDI